MRYSKLFGKTTRAAPADAETASHKLLAKAGFVDQLMTGVYSFLPLGWRAHRKIEQIIREEMNAIGGQEVFLPTLQKKSQWLKTGRWETIDPPLFKFKDRHGRELALGPTHEEVITDLASRFVKSYRDLPLYLYQIQNKFRNEMRSTGGLLRVREFVMKDLYSFHTDKEDLAAYFIKVKEAYRRIFERCELPAAASKASGGTIGGTTTYEFQVPASAGEDKIIYCPDCQLASNKEVSEFRAGQTCPECQKGPLEEVNTIEVGHIFNLGTVYSEKIGAYFTDQEGVKKPIWMGCYGIGLGRLLAAIVETHHDERGIIWPSAAAPFAIHLVDLTSRSFKTCKTYEELVRAGVEVLYDDREDVSAGVKFADADLIGLPWRVVVSEESLKKGGVEVKRRGSERTEIVGAERLLKTL